MFTMIDVQRAGRVQREQFIRALFADLPSNEWDVLLPELSKLLEVDSENVELELSMGMSGVTILGLVTILGWQWALPCSGGMNIC